MRRIRRRGEGVPVSPCNTLIQIGLVPFYWALRGGLRLRLGPDSAASPIIVRFSKLFLCRNLVRVFSPGIVFASAHEDCSRFLDRFQHFSPT